MQNSHFLGIDPGVSGAFAVIKSIGEVELVGLFPDRRILIDWLKLGHTASAAVEKVTAMPGQGVVSMFTFGASFGFMCGVLEAYSVPYELITPKKWQGAILDFQLTKEVKKEDESKKEHACRVERDRRAKKEALTAFVLRRYPDLYHLLKIKKNQGIADAICLALYARLRAISQPAASLNHSDTLTS
jgi:crossover junction endodeoxyribonuclease RuvC